MESGSRLGPYEIRKRLGAGGMGEVYLARDTRLGRDVAVKVLPAEFASDAERLARFEQEARAAAALNHPHIAAVFDVGTANGTHFMVQEYLRGQSLRERLQGGAIGLDRALDLAIEVGEALAAAQRAGIVHRDLKPDNIFVTEEGHAKVLDFGLAKLTAAVLPSGEMSESPTVFGTVAGQVMGTAGYMAPEQVRGDEIDARADLFALGCVLYEMLTGRNPFVGANVHETLSRILESQPEPIHSARADLPMKLGWIVDKALAKRPDRRYESAAGLSADLSQLREEVAAGVVVAASGPVSTGAARRNAPGVSWEVAVPATIAMAVVAALAGSWLSNDRVGDPDADVVRFGFDLPDDLGLAPLGRSLAVSPDGRQVVYAGWPALRLNRRPLSSLESAPIEGTDGAVSPFVSPDGEWIGFLVGSDLKKVRASGGDPVTLCEACVSLGSLPDWSPLGDAIVFEQDGALWRVSSEGGDTLPLATPNTDAGEVRYRSPDVLPRGDAALISLERSDRPDGIAVVDFATGTVQVIAERGVSPRYSSTGHAVYRNGSTLYAVPYPSDGSSPDPTPVLEPVGGAYAVSENGVLVYSVPSSRRRPVWVQRDGGEVTPFLPEFVSGLHSPRLSPDGTKLALSHGGLWVHDLAGRPPYLVVEGGAYSTLWTPDGTSLIFEHNGAIVRHAPSGPGPHDPASFPWAAGHIHATAWAPDGRLLLERINVLSAEADDVEQWSDFADVLTVVVDGNAVLEPLVQTRAAESEPAMAPGGPWLAYVSDATGNREVWVRAYPDGSPVRVSTAGGYHPVWARDGTELYYRQGARMLAVSVGPGPELDVGPPVELFSGAYTSGPFGGQVPSYDVHPDGRFLMIEPESAGFTVNVVLNWPAELVQRPATDR